MSKAFTSEETEEQGPITRAPPTLAPGEVRYVTPEGHAELKEAAARLREQREAAGPTAADLDSRIALVEATLAALTVLGPQAAPEGRVAFGTWVTVEDEEGAVQRFRIVGPDETDARRGRISVHSPIARALLGREVSEVVEVQRPGGPVELTIRSVEKTPPRA